MPSAVTILVYDLSQGLAPRTQLQTGIPLDGIWHSSIAVFNREIEYGAQGLTSVSPPETTYRGRPHRTVDVGRTELDEGTFRDYLEQLKAEYKPEKFHISDFNGNRFSADVVSFLTGSKFPPWITNLPYAFLESPFGRSIRPQLEQLFRGPSAPPPQQPSTFLSAPAGSGGAGTPSGFLSPSATGPGPQQQLYSLHTGGYAGGIAFQPTGFGAGGMQSPAQFEQQLQPPSQQQQYFPPLSSTPQTPYAPSPASNFPALTPSSTGLHNPFAPTFTPPTRATPNLTTGSLPPWPIFNITGAAALQQLLNTNVKAIVQTVSPLTTFSSGTSATEPVFHELARTYGAPGRGVAFARVDVRVAPDAAALCGVSDLDQTSYVVFTRGSRVNLWRDPNPASTRAALEQFLAS